MATVYSSTGTCGGSSSRQWRIALTYSTSTSNTAITVSWTATIQMKSAAQYGVYLECGGKSTTGYTTSSSSSWNDVCSVSGSTSYTRTTSSQTKTLTASGKGQTVSGYGAADGSRSVSASISVPALASYAVTYAAGTDDAVGNLPNKQTKYYGKSLTLSKATPTRDGYNFLGWSTSKGGSVTHKSGASYTGNAALTLYAIWELKYRVPFVTDLKIGRCNSDGSENDYGSYALITFNFSCDQNQGTNAIASATIDFTVGTASVDVSAEVSSTSSGQSGSVSKVVGGSLGTEDTYPIIVTVTDEVGGSGVAAGVIPAVMFPIDFLGNGRGVSIGKPASREGFDVAWPAYFENLTVGGSEMVDHVVARGNSGDWTYWKFDSGLAICRYAPSTTVITESRTEVSNGYRSESYDAALPFTMKNGTAFGSFVGYLYELRTYLVSSGATLRIIAYTNTAGTISAYPRAVVIGTWK